MAQARCREAGTQLFACTAYGIFQGRRLALAEQFSDLVSNWDEGHGNIQTLTLQMALVERSSRLYSMNKKWHSHP
ncbi:hypothetical protein AZE42_13171 [Rhizopogon vesiculosus]|uniref:Uncharacterized protein n=1 Tax=Rhizopogon vesiculosus TaxID=180088 RepID=A0A1J8R0T5_9AGAM|nr:hypothetical protein AZE42_13171 [Rhizopogon vesiculosus]